MIIRFDHITYVCNESRLEQVLTKFASLGYVESFREIHIPNISPKLKLLHYASRTHSLFFMKKDGSIPVEVISYEKTTKGIPVVYYDLEGDTFTYNTKDVEALKGLYCCLGVKKDIIDSYNVKGVLDKANTYVSFEKVDNPSTNLDNEGFTCPTLFVDSFIKIKTKVEESGYCCTECSPISINGRDLKIFFIVGKFGEVLELISNK